MAVEHRNPHALAGDLRRLRLHDLAVLHVAQHPQGLLLAFLFLSADVGDDILHHLRPVLKCLARSGDRLIGSGHHFLRTELLPGRQAGRIALDGTVGLHRDKSPGGPKPLLLIRDHVEVIDVHLRDHHGHIRRPAVSAVVGDHRRLGFRVVFLDLADLVLGHIHRAEHKVHAGGYLLHLVYICHDQLLYRFRHRRIHLPAAAYRLLISLAGRTRACRHRHNLKPGVVLQQGDKPLSHHSCSS